MNPLYLSQTFWGEDWDKGVFLGESLGAIGVVVDASTLFDESGEICQKRLRRLSKMRPAVRFWALQVSFGWEEVLRPDFRARAEALGICASILGVDFLCFRGGFSVSPSKLISVAGELDYFSWFLSSSGIGLAIWPVYPLLSRMGDGTNVFGRLLSGLDQEVVWWSLDFLLQDSSSVLKSRVGALVVEFPLQRRLGPLGLEVYSSGVPLVFSGRIRRP